MLMDLLQNAIKVLKKHLLQWNTSNCVVKFSLHCLKNCALHRMMVIHNQLSGENFKLLFNQVSDNTNINLFKADNKL